MAYSLLRVKVCRRGIYISKGVDSIVLQFKRAGMRLAQVLDKVAAAYYLGVREANPVKPTVEPVFEPSNGYENLTQEELDLEEIVFKWTPPSSSAKAGSMEKETEEPVLEEGTDINNLVLIKRGARYIITHKRRVTSEGFIPKSTLTLPLRFGMNATSTPVEFDLAVFTRALSTEVIAKIFARISGSSAAREVTGSLIGETISFQNRVARFPGFPTEPWHPGFGAPWTSGLLGLMLKKVHLGEPSTLNSPHFDPSNARRILDQHRDDLFFYNPVINDGTELKMNLVVITRFKFMKGNPNNLSFVAAPFLGPAGSQWVLIDARIHDLVEDLANVFETVLGLRSDPKYLKKVTQTNNRADYFNQSALAYFRAILVGFENAPLQDLMNYVAAFERVSLIGERNPLSLEMVIRTPANRERALKALHRSHALMKAPVGSVGTEDQHSLPNKMI